MGGRISSESLKRASPRQLITSSFAAKWTDRRPSISGTWLRFMGTCLCCRSSWIIRVRGGQLETLQWLKTQEGFKLIEGLLSSACKGGHFEILGWLRSEGCPWDEETCAGAAGNGHLEVLKRLR